MSDQRPAVSVVVPVFNGATHVRDAIDSVREQTFREFEIIVVDDGSSDGTGRLLEPLARDGTLRYVYQENRGLPAARNAGIRLARGEYLKFLDHDDLLYPGQLERQVGHLRGRPRDVASVTDWDFEFSDGHKKSSLSSLGKHASLERFLARNQFPVHTVLIARDRVEAAGGFDEDLRACEDLDLWFRILMRGGTFETVDDIGCCYRILPGSMSANSTRLFLEELKVYERVNHTLMARSSELADDVVRGLHVGNAWRAHACFARGLDPVAHMPTALEASHALLARHAGVWKRAVFGLLGTRNVFRMQFLIESVRDRSYRARRSREGWREKGSQPGGANSDRNAEKVVASSR